MDGEEAAAVLASGDAVGWNFRRPPTGSAHAPVPSPHLYVGNALRVPDDELARLAAPRSVLQVTRVVPPRGGCGAYEAAVLTFRSASDAADAAQRLDGAVVGRSDGVRSTPLTARFSLLDSPPACPPPPPPPPGAPVCGDASELGLAGVVLLPCFLSSAEEAALVALLDGPGVAWHRLARRRVAHFGYRFDYASRAADTTSPLGPWPLLLDALRARLALLLPPGSGQLDQLTVNEYVRGEGIAPHVDTHSPFGPSIASVSLCGPAAMEWRRGEARVGLHLPARSALVMSGDARFGWSHGIPSRAADTVLLPRAQPSAHGGWSGDGACVVVVPRGARRLSLTFRSTRPPGASCSCAWPDCCDSRGVGLAAPPARAPGSDRSRASPSAAAAAAAPAPAAPASSADVDTSWRVPDVERSHVWDLYEAIAPHFSATRVAQWPAVRSFLASLPRHSLLLDAGCGNGKYLRAAAAGGHVPVGVDVARALLLLVETEAREGATRCRPAVPPPHHTPPHGDAPSPLALPPRPPCLFRADLGATGCGPPVRRAAFDGALCVAVLHHVSTPARRRALVGSVAGALRASGRALFTAWAVEQSDPQRTTHKWTPVKAPGDDGEDAAGEARVWDTHTILLSVMLC